MTKSFENKAPKDSSGFLISTLDRFLPKGISLTSEELRRWRLVAGSSLTFVLLGPIVFLNAILKDKGNPSFSAMSFFVGITCLYYLRKKPKSRVPGFILLLELIIFLSTTDYMYGGLSPYILRVYVLVPY